MMILCNYQFNIKIHKLKMEKKNVFFVLSSFFYFYLIINLKFQPFIYLIKILFILLRNVKDFFNNITCRVIILV